MDRPALKKRQNEFDDHFSNDAQVCEDIEQLQYTKDFNFLDEFYGVGGDKEDDEEIEDIEAPEIEERDTQTIAPGQAGEQKPPPTVPQMTLGAPDHATSNLASQICMPWGIANFALTQMKNHYETAIKFAENVACPDLPFVGTFPCELVKTIVKGVILVLQKVHVVLQSISENLFKKKCVVNDVAKMVLKEQVAVVGKNMGVSGAYLQKQFEVSLNYLHDSFVDLYGDLQKKNDAQNKYLHTLINGVESSMTDKTNTLSDYIDKETEITHDELGKIKDTLKDLQEEMSKLVAKISFDMHATVSSKENPKAFLRSRRNTRKAGLL